MAVKKDKINKAEPPDALPKGWRIVRFDQMAKHITDRVDNPSEAGVGRYVGLEHLDPESLKIRRWGSPADVEATKLRFRPGDIIFGKRRAYQRKLAVADFEGICSAHAMVLRAREETVIKEFLPFFMQSDIFFDRALAISVGSLSPTINWTTLAEQQFSIPPKDEQRRIADILWAADDNIHKAVDVVEKFQFYQERLMHKLFEPEEINKSGKEVRLVRLGDTLLYASDGPFGSNLKTEHYTDKGARVIRLQNIGKGEFLDDDKAFISEEYYLKLNRYALRSGDIIVAGLGDETHAIGRACRIPTNFGPAINKADCFCLRANPVVIEPEYLFYFLNSPYARHQVQQCTQGTTRFRINVTNLKTINVPLIDRSGQLSSCSVLRALNHAHTQAKAEVAMRSAVALLLRNHLISG